MKYIVVKVWNSGDVSTVEPRKFLTIDEALALAMINRRLDPDHEYLVLQKLC